MQERRILIIEDEADIARLITLHLADDDTQVHHEADGAAGLTRALCEPWDLLLLDLSLPHCDGLCICESVRRQKATLPIVIITARSAEEERIRGLDLGADDYLTKPFSIAELVARVRATFRRADAQASTKSHDLPGGTVIAGDIELRPTSHEASIAGQPVALTAKEFDLLLIFCRSPDRVFPRTDLLREVWGHTHDGYVHTVNTHINRLRAKIEPDPSTPRYITTIWGVGYKLAVA